MAVQVEARPFVFRKGEPNWEPFFYFIPRSKSGLTAPPKDCRARRGWAWDLDGADADQTWVVATLAGNRPTEEVSIANWRVEVVEDVPLPDGSVAACPVGGASSSPTGLQVDLGRKSVSWVASPEADPRPVPRFELKHGEQDAFAIHADAAPGRLVRWRLRAEVIAGGVGALASTPLVVDDNGEPFRTAGTFDASGNPRIPMFEWSGTAWKDLVPYRE